MSSSNSPNNSAVPQWLQQSSSSAIPSSSSAASSPGSTHINLPGGQSSEPHLTPSDIFLRQQLAAQQQQPPPPPQQQHQQQQQQQSSLAVQQAAAAEKLAAAQRAAAAHAAQGEARKAAQTATSNSSTTPPGSFPRQTPPTTTPQQVQNDLYQLQLHHQAGSGGALPPPPPPPPSLDSYSAPHSSSNSSSSPYSGYHNNPDVRSLHLPPSLNQVAAAASAAQAAANGGGGGNNGNNGNNGNSSAGSTGPNRLPPMVGSSNVMVPNLKLKDTTGPSQIFKATYSGVPVLEMICRGVAVMRRRSDSYLNATQILKVAEFDKAQRTRILEREVQRGEHEKVQGGYGKYQGTWVPYTRGVQLCQEYHVMDLLQPLLEYEIKASSPPLAPKHVTAATGKPRKLKEPRAPKAKKSKKSKNLGGPIMGVIDGENNRNPGEDDDDVSNSERDDDMPSRAASEASMDETMSIVTGPSRTPSPLGSRRDLSSSEVSDNDAYSPGGGRRQRTSPDRSPRNRKKQRSRPGDELFVGYNENNRSRRGRLNNQESTSSSLKGKSNNAEDGEEEGDEEEKSWNNAPSSSSLVEDSAQGHYAETLLNYFVSDSTMLPTILTHPPSDLDFDLIIDEEGHTPLHWAVAMARTKIVRLLVQHGADVYRVNNQGQTALMRSVLFTNNFDMKTFPSLLEILQKTIFTIDKNDQTVFHHVAVTAGMRGKVHASRYYMECLLDKLAQHPSELESIINVQDVAGDTALTIAARIGNKKVLKLLLDAGADSKIRNKSGRNADDYLQESDAQFLPTSTLSGLASTFPPPSSSQPLQPPHPQQQQHQQQQPSLHSHSSSLSSHHPQLSLSRPPTPPPHNKNLLSQHPSSSSNSPQNSNGGSSSNPQRGTNMHHHQHPSPSSRQHHGGHGSSPQPYGQSPPPSRHHTYGSSNAPYQEYGHSGSPRNPFQSQPAAAAAASPSHHRVNSARGSPMHESHRGYEEGGHGGDYLAAPSNSYPSAAPSHTQQHHLQPSHHPSSSSTVPAAFSSSVPPTAAATAIGATGPRASQKMIPAVTDLFEQLTQSYENDLHEKEQDLISARNLLHGIQTEIQEGHKTVEELRSKTVYLNRAEEQIRMLEGMIRQEMDLRQRLRLEDLVEHEEGRVKRDMEYERNTSPSTSGTDRLGRTAALEKEATELRTSLLKLQQGRKDQVEQIVQLKSQQGKRRHEYKRLIALCCNVSIEEVDGLLGPLLNTLGNEDTVA